MGTAVNRFIREIDALTEQFAHELDALTLEQICQKPNAQSWSIAQILEHLILFNSSYFVKIQEVRDSRVVVPWISRRPFLVSMMGKLLLKSTEPGNARKIKTFPLWEPDRSSVVNEGIRSDFYAHQKNLIQQIAGAADLLEKGTVISSPANRYIAYTLEDAFTLISVHEKRHLEQIRSRIRAMDLS